MYHPIFSPSHTASSKPFAAHLYQYSAVSRTGALRLSGHVKVPADWGPSQVRKALRQAMPEAFILETSWAPSAESKPHWPVDHDFTLDRPVTTSNNQ